MGKYFVASALRAIGASVELLTDIHPSGSKDPIGFPDVCERGWVILTKDKKMRKHPVELAAIVRHGGRAFIFTGGNVKGPDMARVFQEAMPRILKVLEENRPPFIAAISAGGAVSLVYPRA